MKEEIKDYPAYLDRPKHSAVEAPADDSIYRKRNDLALLYFDDHQCSAAKLVLLGGFDSVIDSAIAEAKRKRDDI